MSYGPRCPNRNCQEPHELVMSELSERVYFPKTFMCSHCMEIWTLDVDEMEVVIKNARVFYGLDKENNESASETPEDWARLRERWDNGDAID